MTPTFVLGRIAGIRIGLNWTWTIVFGLLVWSLAHTIFPEAHPGLTGGRYLAMALAGALLFFGSLLLHELGHALQARREGLHVESITLWLFGGVARLGGELPGAGTELRVAAAGPAVSAVLGGAFLGLAQVTQLGGGADDVISWLAWINLLLLAFNLLPALPLDGGRVLRAALWRLRRDFGWATRVAAGVSRLLAFGLIAGGVAMLLAWGSFGGLWLSFIGWFLLQAAAAETRDLPVRAALMGLRVRDVMQPSPIALPWLGWNGVTTVAGDDAAVEALYRLSRSPWGRAVVVDDGRVVGVVSLSDFERLLPPPRPRRVRFGF